MSPYDEDSEDYAEIVGKIGDVLGSTNKEICKLCEVSYKRQLEFELNCRR